MIFNREDLIKRVEETIARKHVEAGEKHDKNLNAFYTKVDEWRDRYNEKWVAYAERLIRTLDLGEPITEEIGKPPQYSSDSWWRGLAYLHDEKAPDFKPADVSELTAMLEALKADTGKSVSQNALERMGFRKLKDLGLFG
jgi:hypothetical protein